MISSIVTNSFQHWQKSDWQALFMSSNTKHLDENCRRIIKQIAYLWIVMKWSTQVFGTSHTNFWWLCIPLQSKNSMKTSLGFLQINHSALSQKETALEMGKHWWGGSQGWQRRKEGVHQKCDGVHRQREEQLPLIEGSLYQAWAPYFICITSCKPQNNPRM